MALRSLSRTSPPSTSPTSGPGRARGSDGRAADGRGSQRHARRRAARRRHASAEVLRLRAERLFAESERAGGGVGLRSGAPPDARREAPSAAGRPAPEPAVRPDTEPPVRGRAGLAVRERLPLWLQLRCGLERRSLIALAAVLVLATVFAAQHFWAGRTLPVRAPEVVRAASDGEAEPSPSPGVPPPESGSGRTVAGSTAGAEGSAGGEAGGGIVVDISGKVRSPGILRLPAGSRVADALKAAGGVRPGADTDGLNRARLLIDGEQVVVGAPGVAPAVPGAGVAAGPTGASPAAPVGLNTATAEQLDGLPGVGPVLAQHIIDYRTEHGGFRSVDELREVNGIGDRRFADLRNLVRP
ncbi:ComEA family DNA-binding protein [Streptomyces sp. MZ04]|uniref:ComEA family DNA-binding protein n=1 Tax=Streptomyces sp. MZ04 TaxID=2559236 RepID=UPI00107E8396|nr:ComEA family DNA-binding protein [Streptomyces sp. MZ04]TGA90476.1 ComEA family DNA-binding protein [Streptomyces sp. MZ04]